MGQKLGIVFVILSLFLAACQGKFLEEPEQSSVGSAAEDDYGFVQNSYGARVSWKTKIPVTVQVDPLINEEFFNAASRAADRWNSLAGKKLIVLEKLPRDEVASPSQDLSSGLYWRTEWADEKNNQQAVTTLFYKGSLISEADIKINAKDFNFYANEPNSNREVHMESLLVHEFGHLLGLKHSTVWPTVMWSTLAANTVRDVISEKDLSSLKCEY